MWLYLQYQPVFITSTGKYGSSGRGDLTHSANLGLSCTTPPNQKPWYLLLGQIELVADNGTTVVVDDFSYHALAPDAWGPGSSWVFQNGSKLPVLRLDCPPNATTTVMRPVASSSMTQQHQQTQQHPQQLLLQQSTSSSSSPCTTKPQPCQGHPGVTYCVSVRVEHY